jgi:putative redox protein
MNPQIKATTPTNTFTTEIEARHHRYTADEPTSQNGNDRGMTPGELLAASLASCTSITLRMYTQRKGWDTGNIQVTVEYHKDEAQKIQFERKITLEKTLEAAQMDRIVSIANACPVHKILSGEINIHTLLEQ